MHRADSLDDAAARIAEIGRPVVTIGTFDGVHLGHQKVLACLREWADALEAPATVITFRHHPRLRLTGKSPEMITTVEHRLLLFERFGVDLTIVLAFDETLSQLGAEAFLRDVLVGRLTARGLQLGFDSRFGRGGEGTPERARAWGETLGLPVRVTEPVTSPESADAGLSGGRPISSTAIREAIWNCELERAAALLGRRVSVLGTVVRGAARGRRLGFRTANLDLQREVRPPYGVYATLARLPARDGGRLIPSVTNVGSRPTVETPPPGMRSDLLIETHLLEFEGDLYGEKLEVIFVKKLREERRFGCVEDLVEQIRRDVKVAMDVLRAAREVQSPEKKS